MSIDALAAPPDYSAVLNWQMRKMMEYYRLTTTTATSSKTSCEALGKTGFRVLESRPLLHTRRHTTKGFLHLSIHRFQQSAPCHAHLALIRKHNGMIILNLRIEFRAHGLVHKYIYPTCQVFDFEEHGTRYICAQLGTLQIRIPKNPEDWQRRALKMARFKSARRKSNSNNCSPRKSKLFNGYCLCLSR